MSKGRGGSTYKNCRNPINYNDSFFYVENIVFLNLVSWNSNAQMKSFFFSPISILPYSWLLSSHFTLIFQVQCRAAFINSGISPLLSVTVKCERPFLCQHGIMVSEVEKNFHTSQWWCSNASKLLPGTAATWCSVVVTTRGNLRCQPCIKGTSVVFLLFLILSLLFKIN